MPFDAGDASGWDECLPSVAECSITTASRYRRKFPITATSGALAWEPRSQAMATPLRLYAELFFPARSRSNRTLELIETAKAVRLKLDLQAHKYRRPPCALVMGGTPALRR